MAVQWMPPPLQRRTLWRFALEEHAFVQWAVLRYLAVELVILFGNLEDVNCAHHTLPDMTELQDEAATVQTMAPTKAHVAAFIGMWHSNPTTWDGELHTPPQQIPPSEETPHCLHAQLGDLNDSEL